MKPEIAFIVAQARNGVIGRENALPWHCPSDLQHFKRLTMGKAMIMGRKTWDSIGKPLPGRVSIVVSSYAGEHAERIKWVKTIDAAITAAQNHPLVADHSEVMIIGGAQIYAAALPRATKIYRTLVDADVEGDAFFPELGMEWRLVEDAPPIQSDKDEFPLRMQVWKRA